MTGNYLTLLEESLKSKLQVMAEIQAYNLRQQEISRRMRRNLISLMSIWRKRNP